MSNMQPVTQYNVACTVTINRSLKVQSWHRRSKASHHETVWGVELWFHAFLISASDEGEWSASRLRR